MVDSSSKFAFIKQFMSYFCVGGIAAIVEWIMFAIFANALHISYLISTCLAFVFSTTTNLLLGKIWTFKNNSTYKNNRLGEAIAVFAVSAIGLGLNIVLMYLFVSVVGLNTGWQTVASKIMATGIVFIWNFLIRKFFVYK